MATTIVADWKLEETCGRVFGVCYIEFSPPYDKFDFTQGFTLPNPTHLRCALQSIVTAYEAIRGCAFLKESKHIIVATKNSGAYRLLTDPNCVKKWVGSNWPKVHKGNKTLLTRAYNMVSDADKELVTFVCVDRDGKDPAYVDLDEGRNMDGLDVDKLRADGKKPEEIEVELRNTRMRGVMAQRLIGTGAKSYRNLKKKA